MTTALPSYTTPRDVTSAFYKTINMLSDIKLQEGAADFRLLDRRALDAILQFEETELFFRGIVPRIGFSTEVIHFAVGDRRFGATKYSFKRMLKLAKAGTINVSTKPLRIAIAFAMVLIAFAGIYGIYTVVAFFLSGTAVPGWASLVEIVLILGAMQLCVLGIIGEYIAQILHETRRRPSFIVRETEGSWDK